MAKAMLRARPTLVSGLTAITGESSPARRLVKRFQVGEQGAPLLVCELPLRHRLGELVALGVWGPRRRDDERHPHCPSLAPPAERRCRRPRYPVCAEAMLDDGQDNVRPALTLPG